MELMNESCEMIIRMGHISDITWWLSYLVIYILQNVSYRDPRLKFFVSHCVYLVYVLIINMHFEWNSYLKRFQRTHKTIVPFKWVLTSFFTLLGRKLSTLYLSNISYSLFNTRISACLDSQLPSNNMQELNT